MTGKAVVYTVHDDRAELFWQRDSMPESCCSSGKEDCTVCGCAAKDGPAKRRSFIARIPEGMQLQPGDSVLVQAGALSALAAALLLFGLPLITGALVYRFLPGLSEAGRTGLAFLAFLAAGALSVVLGRAFFSRHLPGIIEKSDPQP